MILCLIKNQAKVTENALPQVSFAPKPLSTTFVNMYLLDTA